MADPLKTGIERIKGFAASGDWNSVLEVVQQLLNRYPDNNFLLTSAHNAALKKGEKAVASDFISKAVELNPDNATNHLLKGRFHKGIGELSEARKALEEALRISPDTAAIEATLADTIAALGDVAQALPHYKRAVELNPREKAWWVRYGRTALKAGDAAQAEAAFAGAIALGDDPVASRLLQQAQKMRFLAPAEKAPAKAAAAASGQKAKSGSSRVPKPKKNKR